MKIAQSSKNCIWCESYKYWEYLEKLTQIRKKN